MSEKCFCHLNGYKVKDADARRRLDEIEKDHADNTGFVLMMEGLAENPENDGKVYGIKDEEIVPMDLPQGVANIMTFDSVEEMNATSAPEGTIALVPSEESTGGGGLPVVEITSEPTEDGWFCSETENNALNSAWATGLPIICKMNAQGAALTIIANRMESEAINAFAASNIMITCANESWSVSIQ